MVKWDQHQLIAKLKDLAIELGKTPSRREFEHHVGYGYGTHFGSFSTFIQAAGLQPSKPKKINNTIFETDINRHLEQFVPSPKNLKQLSHPNAAIISDIHWPFSSQRVIDRFYEYVGDTKPDWVILNGDAWDMYSHAKFPRSHNIFTPREEEQRARSANEEFWKRIHLLAPKAQKKQMLGNHDVRPMKRILEAYPEAEDWIKERLQKMFTFDGVETIFDVRQELMLNAQTAVFHGYRSKLGDHMSYTLMNCINGHTHRGGVVCRQIHGLVLYEANSGLAGDPEAKGLTYTPQKIIDWTPGFLGIDKLGARFISV